MPAERLKPCPFCWSDGDAYIGLAKLGTHYCVQCSVCEASGPWQLYPEQAEAAWNNRGDASGAGEKG